MSFDKELFSIKLSDKERKNEDRLLAITDKIIAQLVIKKNDIQLAYDYYNCIRNKDRFRYLEDLYGINNPTSLEFIPLVRRHIDYLIGQLLSDRIKPKVTCKDFKSLKNIKEQKETLKKDSELSFLKEKLYSNIRNGLSGKEIDDTDPSDAIQNLFNKIDQEFVSNYEIAAQYLLKNITLSKNVNLLNKVKTLFKDYLVTGEMYYKVNMFKQGNMPEIEVYHPANVFFEKNHNSPYVKDASKAVVIKYMNYTQILDQYGERLSDDDIDKLLHELPHQDRSNENSFYMRIPEGEGAVPTVYPHVGTLGGFANSNTSYGYEFTLSNLLPVYEVEWIETFKKDGKIKTERYTTTRIGQDVYVLTGPDDDTVYNNEKTDRATLSINGMCNLDRTGKPYSLVLATSSLQDKYDITFFHIDTLMSTAGTKGSIVDVNTIPEYLDADPIARIEKWLAWKKGGVALIDSSELNSAFNTIFNGYDDTINGNAIQAYQLVLQQIEYECSSVTGVYKESLNKIEQRDAVTNVQTGLKQSEIITKPLFNAIDDITSQILYDMLNVCKISFRKGFIGNVILNDLNEVFTIEPDNFVYTDFDVHIDNSDSTAIAIQKIDAYTMELLKGQMVDADVIINGITSDSLTEMKKNLLEALEKKKKEVGATTQLQQQNAQLQQQLEQLNKQLQEVSQKLQQAEKENQEHVNASKVDELKLKKQDLDRKDVIENRKLDLQEQQVKAEVAQLFDQNRKNNEIKNII